MKASLKAMENNLRNYKAQINRTVDKLNRLRGRHDSLQRAINKVKSTNDIDKFD